MAEVFPESMLTRVLSAIWRHLNKMGYLKLKWRLSLIVAKSSILIAYFN